MNEIDKLTEQFKEFPGIGPRQAKRFVYFLLQKNDAYIHELVKLIPKLKDSIRTCNECQRYFPPENNIETCVVCLDDKREPTQLLVVSRDTDMESIEKSGVYNGYYFVLGGIVPALEEANAGRFIKIDKLKKRVEKLAHEGLHEVILAMNANPDGDNTADYLRKELKDICQKNNLKLTILGRGLSTGTELEYSDRNTIKNALINRG